MVYKFDPKYVDGTSFCLEDWNMAGDFMECWRANKPIPASYFPKSLQVDDANQVLPDIFHTSRDIIVFSDRARSIMEEGAPGQVEFIPVAIYAKPGIEHRLQLAGAYYFINILGRAQRLQWLEMPVSPGPIREGGLQIFGVTNDYPQWKFRQRLPSEPLIWHEIWWLFENKEYRGHSHILIEDTLWHELDTNFPGQLHPIQVGISIN